MEILHSAGRVGMRVRIPFSECSVTVTLVFGPIGARWWPTCSVNHMFSCILWPNQTLDRMTGSAVSRVFQCGRLWRVPRHWSALRSAAKAPAGQEQDLDEQNDCRNR